MKCDHNDSSAGSHSTHRGIQKNFEIPQFVVHKDAQGLKGARGWMNSAVTRTAGHPLNRANKIRRCLKRTRPNDRPGDRARAAFLAVIVENAGNVFFGVGVQYISSREWLRTIHPHVEGAFMHE